MSSGSKTIPVAVGFAADRAGTGAAYARIGARTGSPVVRVPFSVHRLPALAEREVGYAALAQVAVALRRRGLECVRFLLADDRLREDVLERRDVPQALTLAYVRLRCILHQFRRFEIDVLPSEHEDLVLRARSEVATRIAA